MSHPHIQRSLPSNCQVSHRTRGTVVHRGYIDIPMEPESLDDSFEIIITLPNSDGTTTSFSYVK